MPYYILKSFRFNGDLFPLFNVFKYERYPFFLDSSLNCRWLGRFSFLGCNPFYTLRAKSAQPFKELRHLLDKHKVPPLDKLSPFLSGAVGYLAYDLGFELEKKLSRTIKDDLFIPDYFFGFYGAIIICDHFRKKMHIFSSGLPEKRYNLAKARARLKFKQMLKLISRVQANEKQKIVEKRGPHQVPVESNFSREGYVEAVKKSKEYIKKGDIYQVNISQRFSGTVNSCGSRIYQRLRSISPSFFSAYLNCGDFEIISSSPERFLNVKGRTVTTRPMKGTRARAADKYKDNKLKKSLLDSPKDKAELVMIVDLERNDLGKTCNYGSVKVESLRELETYNTVFQTTATVKGVLHKDKDRVDLIKSCFPGGSITGCPKIRSMEIIEQLETVPRSIYTGCLGYLSFCGNMDLNIMIRTILKKNNRVYFHTGAGIVADSVPEDEYEETLAKAKAMAEAIS